jgi:hypothetical protein
VNVTGTWGDLPEDLVLTLASPTQVNVFWKVPTGRSPQPT